ncbi:MAG: PhzF family phenazine biosynthesis protein [Spirochaetaceae bacterium]|jgi:PhzF family phenazine biosynthesis protein|nr:PhzF family phenazine biosynthesis protein [Spirochaetaceae bacterium]
MKIYIVDSFTEQPFKGNPAAVCITDNKLGDAEYQNIAMEMNLSETAFLLRQSETDYELRWFTPTEEVNLCGHATLAGAHILWEKGFEKSESILSFHSKSGLLKASLNEGWITLDFPAKPLKPSRGDEYLFKAIPGTIERVLADGESYIVVLKDENDIRKMTPLFDLFHKTARPEIIITAKSKSEDYDFVSRFFGPAIGIKEDPVTGSAHCYLAPYWSEILDKKELTGYQASKRGGYVRCTVAGNRVHLKGKACTVLSGDIEI